MCSNRNAQNTTSFARPFRISTLSIFGVLSSGLFIFLIVNWTRIHDEVGDLLPSATLSSFPIKFRMYENREELVKHIKKRFDSTLVTIVQDNEIDKEIQKDTNYAANDGFPYTSQEYITFFLKAFKEEELIDSTFAKTEKSNEINASKQEFFEDNTTLKKEISTSSSSCKLALPYSLYTWPPYSFSSNSTASDYFNQGMILVFAFNHDEALRSFKLALQYDSNCALCYWGIAYALGPNINRGQSQSRIKEAQQALLDASKLLDLDLKKWKPDMDYKGLPLENSLVYSQYTRYFPFCNTTNYSIYEDKYSKAMEKVQLEFPDNVDVLSLYAESIMNTMPWNYTITVYKLEEDQGKMEDYKNKMLSIHEISTLQNTKNDETTRDSIEQQEKNYSKNYYDKTELLLRRRRTAHFLNFRKLNLDDKNNTLVDNSRNTRRSTSYSDNIEYSVFPTRYEIPKNATLTVIKVLEKAYILQPTHPLVLHLLIHIIEPLKDLMAIASIGASQGAMGLEHIVPPKTPGLGHLIHMPSHIWFKLGHYYRAGQANIVAIENDENYFALCNINSELDSYNWYYRAIYYTHKHAFLTYTSTMTGQFKLSIKTAIQLKTKCHVGKLVPVLGGVLNFYPTWDLMVLLRFGKWQTVLEISKVVSVGSPSSFITNNMDESTVTEKEETNALPSMASLRFEDYVDDLRFTKALISYARSYALVSSGECENAQIERQVLLDALLDKDFLNEPLFVSTTKGDILHIAYHTLNSRFYQFGCLVMIGETDGQTIVKDEDYNDFQMGALEEMKKAVYIQYTLPYFEPPMWLTNIGSCLGQLYLDYKMYEQAEKVFRFDLINYPENGWSLKGLQLALEKQGKSKEAKIIESKFREEWKHADAEIKSACF